MRFFFVPLVGWHLVGFFWLRQDSRWNFGVAMFWTWMFYRKPSGSWEPRNYGQLEKWLVFRGSSIFFELPAFFQWSKDMRQQFSSNTAGVTNYSKSVVIYNRRCSMFFFRIFKESVCFFKHHFSEVRYVWILYLWVCPPAGWNPWVDSAVAIWECGTTHWQVEVPSCTHTSHYNKLS